MPEELDRVAAALADRYRIEREIGAGGMATVYLGEDLRHRRKVAVKVLRPVLAASLGPERFLREIEIAAQLQHPNILPLLESGEALGFLYYVMPFVEGESLRDRLAREGELPVPDAVRLLCEVADALAEAHRRGVVHRDIKPDNVLLSGRHALLADFGIAKAVSEATGRQQLTTAGIALGTPAYMAPEQAAASPQVDHRADIYALGALAYEMLAGRPPFLGTTPQAVLAAHVTQAPDPLSRYRPTVVPDLEQAVMRCLAKRPADRFQSADELLAALEPLAAPSVGITPTATQSVAVAASSHGLLRGLVLGIGGVAVLVVTAVWLMRSRAVTPSATLGRQVQVTSDPGLEVDPAISPDGKLVAYAAGLPGQMRVYVRQVGSDRAIALTPTGSGHYRAPHWSPDGAMLAYSVSDSGRWSVQVVPALGGTARTVLSGTLDDADRGANDVCWSPDGKRLALALASRLVTVALDGTDEVRVTRPLAVGDAASHSVSWSPDGRWLAFVEGNSAFTWGVNSFGNIAPSRIRIASVDGQVSRTVSDSIALYLSPVWGADGRSLFYISNRDGRRDLFQLPLTAGAEPAGPARRITTGLNAQTISLTPDGRHLAYSVVELRANIWSLPIDGAAPASASDAVPVTTGTQAIETLALSADGAWLAFESDRDGNADIYKLRLAGGDQEKLTTDAHNDFAPTWSPDAKALAFMSYRAGNRDVFVMNADGTGQRPLTPTPESQAYPIWSHAGGYVCATEEPVIGMADSRIIVYERDSTGGWMAPRPLVAHAGICGWTPDDHVYFGRDGALWSIAPDSSDLRREFALDSAIQPSYLLWLRTGEVIIRGRDPNGLVAFFAWRPGPKPPRMVARFSDPARQPRRPTFATDGKRIYFILPDHQSDIWVSDVN